MARVWSSLGKSLFFFVNMCVSIDIKNTTRLYGMIIIISIILLNTTDGKQQQHRQNGRVHQEWAMSGEGEREREREREGSCRSLLYYYCLLLSQVNIIKCAYTICMCVFPLVDAGFGHYFCYLSANIKLRQLY